jgi:hypothetical protein
MWPIPPHREQLTLEVTDLAREVITKLFVTGTTLGLDLEGDGTTSSRCFSTATASATIVAKENNSRIDTEACHKTEDMT